MSASPPGILFTAFEPSGDVLAARVVEVVRRRRPDLPIWALGGPKMRDAGAELIESSTDRAVMLAGAAAQGWSHHKRLGRLRAWLSDHRLSALVAVDSPAANWSICKLIRRQQPRARIVHLVAPQLWAWAPWRIGKLRRLTDQVLCLLPFEPPWFDQRGVPAAFVGHPLYDPPPNTAAWADQVAQLPQGDGPKLAMLPGSRHAEVKANWPTMAGAIKALRRRHPSLQAVVAAHTERISAQVVALTGRVDPSVLDVVQIEVGNTDAVLSWSDSAVVVSGTATLQAAAIGVPMVVLYEVNRLVWHLVGRWMIRARAISLPNLITQDEGLGHVVPELMPNFGAVNPVVSQVDRLLSDPSARTRQLEAFSRIRSRFSQVRFAQAAADRLLGAIDAAAG